MPQFRRRKLKDNMNPRSLVIAVTEETERPSVVYLKETRMCFLILSDAQIMFLSSYSSVSVLVMLSYSLGKTGHSVVPLEI